MTSPTQPPNTLPQETVPGADSIQKNPLPSLTKIVATLGPASNQPDSLRALLEAGVSVCRINFSHGDNEALLPVVETIKAVRAQMSRPIAILGDIQGPKFRVGTMVNHEPIPLKEGERVHLSNSTDPGEPGHIRANQPALIQALSPGQRVLLDDGTLHLQVEERLSVDTVVCRVILGGTLKERKGINVPDLRINTPILTQKDEQDCRFALKHAFDFIALSFVQSARDIQSVRTFIEGVSLENTHIPKLVAKIERPQALDEIDAIIEATDAVMVARGDLGVELSPERVPMAQKEIIAKANKAGKPVITATQMLESMIENATPTRAEVSDVANAVMDGSDALMLSAETAVGKYPVAVIEIMTKIMAETEKHLFTGNGETSPLIQPTKHVQDIVPPAELSGPMPFHESIAHLAAHAGRKTHAKAIAVLSYSGSMARRISKCRPAQPIIALTPRESVYRRLSLLWGLYPVLIDAPENSDQALLRMEQILSQFEFIQPSDTIVFCAGRTHLAGISNTLKIYQYGDIQRAQST